MKKITIFILFSVLILQLCGCSTSTHTTLTEEVFPGVEEMSGKIPSIADVSAGVYQIEEIYRFPIVECAYLYRHGNKEILEKDDPRLMNLLNLLEISEQNDTTYWQRSYISESEIRECYNAAGIMVEVIFSDVAGDGYNSDLTALLICKDSYLTFLNTAEGYSWLNHGERLAERKWAYRSVFVEAINAGAIEESCAAQYEKNFEWNGEVWVDLIAYCGFQ